MRALEMWRTLQTTASTPSTVVPERGVGPQSKTSCTVEQVSGVFVCVCV